MIAGFALSISLALAGGILARRSVRQLSDGRDDPGFLWSSGAALIGAICGFWLVLASGSGASPVLAAVISALLLSMSGIDRQTAWVPDVLAYPFAALCAIWAASSAGMSVWALLGAGALACLGYALLQHLFLTLSDRLPALPPPPDLLAFLAGPALLGISIHFAIALLAMFALLMIIRFFPGIQSLSCEDKLQAARSDLGYDEAMGPAVPLLGVIFPIYFILFLLQVSESLRHVNFLL